MSDGQRQVRDPGLEVLLEGGDRLGTGGAHSEAKIATLERMVGRQALEIEFLKGALQQGRLPRSAPMSVIAGPAVSPDGNASTAGGMDPRRRWTRTVRCAVDATISCSPSSAAAVSAHLSQKYPYPPRTEGPPLTTLPKPFG